MVAQILLCCTDRVELPAVATCPANPIACTTEAERSQDGRADNVADLIPRVTVLETRGKTERGITFPPNVTTNKLSTFLGIIGHHFFL